ncbi:hypothetical protein ACEN34_12965, partial [Loigolactobacillus zhaoyuanensis]
MKVFDKASRWSWVNNIWIGMLSIILSFTYSSNPIIPYDDQHDGSMFYYFGRIMNQGLHAYSDAFDHKGPLLFYINALGYPTVFGIKLLWIIEIISLFLTL